MDLQVLEHKKLHAGWIMLLKVVSSSCSYFHIRLAFMGTSFVTKKILHHFFYLLFLESFGAWYCQAISLCLSYLFILFASITLLDMSKQPSSVLLSKHMRYHHNGKDILYIPYAPVLMKYALSGWQTTSLQALGIDGGQKKVGSLQKFGSFFSSTLQRVQKAQHITDLLVVDAQLRSYYQ